MFVLVAVVIAVAFAEAVDVAELLVAEELPSADVLLLAALEGVVEVMFIEEVLVELALLVVAPDGVPRELLLGAVEVFGATGVVAVVFVAVLAVGKIIPVMLPDAVNVVWVEDAVVVVELVVTEFAVLV